MTAPRDLPSQGATISACGTYRYDLWRQWGSRPWVLWVMLNPSTADASVDDPTIRRCLGFTRTLGCDGLAVVNLYAYRTTSPAMLAAADAPRGSENMATIRRWLADPRVANVVCAWGAGWRKLGIPRLNVEGLADAAGHRTVCLGMTKTGDPRHPLYVRGTQPLEPWPP